MQPAVHTFPRARRLLAKADFDAVFAHPDLKQRGQGVLLLIKRRPLEAASRIGFVLAKRHLKRAVDRNRLRRACREAFRQRGFSVPIDIVVLAMGHAKSTLDSPLTPLFDALFDRVDRKLAEGQRAGEPRPHA